MKAKTMNIVYILIMYIYFTTSTNAQKSIPILLNSQRINAQIQNGQIVSLDKQISQELLEAIRTPIVRDAHYFKELNDIIAGKYGNYYAELVKQELLAIKKGIIVPEKEKLSYTAVADIADTKVKFVSASARLDGKSSDLLVKLVSRLRTMNVNFVMLEGYKKSNSITDYILTTNRINACKDYLIYKGIDKQKIKTKISLSTTDVAASKSVLIKIK